MAGFIVFASWVMISLIMILVVEKWGAVFRLYTKWAYFNSSRDYNRVFVFLWPMEFVTIPTLLFIDALVALIDFYETDKRK